MLFEHRISIPAVEMQFPLQEHHIRYLIERREHKNEFCDSVAACYRNGTMLEVSGGWSFAGIDILKRKSSLHAVTVVPDQRGFEWRHHVGQAEAVAQRERLVLGDDGRLPFADGSFELVVSVNRLHQWSVPEQVLAELYRVTRLGGSIWISDLRRDADEWIAEYVIRELHRDTSEYGRYSLDRFVRAWRASYTATELNSLLCTAGLSGVSQYEDDGAMARTVVINKAERP